jgi:uncharacterized protein YrrD
MACEWPGIIIASGVCAATGKPKWEAMITAKQLYEKEIDAEKNHMGAVHDLYFDDQAWTLRYLVVDTGKWLPGRKVLIVPEAILLPWHDGVDRTVPVRLTREQVKSSPDIDTAQRISRQAEQILHSHYGWIQYWEVPGVPASPPLPQSTLSRKDNRAIKDAESTGGEHLRSTKEVRGYRVHATDGEIGHIEDFLFDDDCRRILFLSVDLEEWLSSKQVLIPPRLVSRIDWAGSTLHVELTCKVIKTSQEYMPET